MRINGMNGVFPTAAWKTLPRSKTASPSAAAVRTSDRDTVELSFRDIATAERKGYIEVGGEQVSVSAEMAERMRQAYDAAAARNEAAMLRNTLLQNQEAAKRQSEAFASEAKRMKQAMEIAARIAKGGRVPPQDEKFLMEYSQEMYLAAKMEAMAAKEHKKHDSVLEDEEETEDTGVELDKTVHGVEATVSGGDGPTVESVSVSVSEA